jgi:hypothetical protein
LRPRSKCGTLCKTLSRKKTMGSSKTQLQHFRKEGLVWETWLDADHESVFLACLLGKQASLSNER